MPAPKTRREPCCLSMADTLEMKEAICGMPAVVRTFIERVARVEQRLSVLEGEADGDALKLRPINPDSFPDDWN